ncbi:redoxin domain-containing protein [Flavobacterium aestivum]|uniref:redoxin domain-containing protein n=1 Tax=Flavobacterium aestivum TaxID=3003257 RepID=UPI002285DAC3|nr:redoxin domain-containing protein [Flavobacterium aestivum]
MRRKILLVALLIAFEGFGQIKLKVGDASPKLTVTDYIENVPENKNFKNSYILLEFWATWCSTCLQEVPKLNQLQEQFKSNKDLVFVSMTDEKPEKVMRTLKRIPFKSIVVSDQKREVHKNYFANDGNSIAYPSTILIDNKGIIRWIGGPDLINETILKKLINNEEIKITDNNTDDLFPPSPHSSTTKSLIDNVYKDTTNDSTQYSFSLLKGEINGATIQFNSLKDEGLYVDTNNDLTTILSNLTGLFNSLIAIPENLKSNKYSIMYKNKNLKSENGGILDIKNNLLKALSLEEKIVNRNVDTYILRVKDKSKLEEIINEKDKKDGANMTHLLLANIEIETLKNTISRNFKVFVKDETNLTGNYDFILRKDSEKNLISDLEIYGLTLVKEKKDIQFYEYQ